MLIIVGHGASAYGEWEIDDHTIVRLATAGWDKPGRKLPHPGTRTDYVCSTLAKYDPDWLITGVYARACWEALAKYQPRFPKPSTGTCAAVIARSKFPHEDIRVIGFDYTMHPEKASNYRHDARAENRLIKDLGITEYG